MKPTPLERLMLWVGLSWECPGRPIAVSIVLVLVGAFSCLGLYQLLAVTAQGGIWQPFIDLPIPAKAIIGFRSAYQDPRLIVAGVDGETYRCSWSSGVCIVTTDAVALDEEACEPLTSSEFAPLSPYSSISVLSVRCRGVDLSIDRRFALLPSGEVVEWSMVISSEMWPNQLLTAIVGLGGLLGVVGGWMVLLVLAKRQE